MVISSGSEAPEVSAIDQSGESREISYENPTVLFFYPEDGTPGCTTEAKQFELERETYREAGVRIVGISTDPVESHRQFANGNDLSITLLSDPDGRLCDAYDVELEQGRAIRTTVVVVGGTVHETYENVQPDGHARDVLLDLLNDGIVDFPES